MVYYTAAAEDVGCHAGTGLRRPSSPGQGHRALDPPLAARNTTGCTRHGESYVKDFKPLRLGILDLNKGRGMLTIRAASIPGRHAIDLTDDHAHTDRLI